MANFNELERVTGAKVVWDIAAPADAALLREEAEKLESFAPLECGCGHCVRYRTTAARLRALAAEGEKTKALLINALGGDDGAEWIRAASVHDLCAALIRSRDLWKRTAVPLTPTGAMVERAAQAYAEAWGSNFQSSKPFEFREVIRIALTAALSPPPVIPEEAYRDRALVILARIERRARPLGVRFDDELQYPRRDW
jgi:hypothetical protein